MFHGTFSPQMFAGGTSWRGRLGRARHKPALYVAILVISAILVFAVWLRAGGGLAAAPVVAAALAFRIKYDDQGITQDYHEWVVTHIDEWHPWPRQ